MTGTSADPCLTALSLSHPVSCKTEDLAAVGDEAPVGGVDARDVAIQDVEERDGAARHIEEGDLAVQNIEERDNAERNAEEGNGEEQGAAERHVPAVDGDVQASNMTTQDVEESDVVDSDVVKRDIEERDVGAQGVEARDMPETDGAQRPTKSLKQSVTAEAEVPEPPRRRRRRPPALASVAAAFAAPQSLPPVPTTHSHHAEGSLGASTVPNLASDALNLVVDLVILCNTVLLCLDGSAPKMSQQISTAQDDAQDALRLALDVCAALFLLELGVRIALAAVVGVGEEGNRPAFAWHALSLRSPVNVLDALAILGSVVGATLSTLGAGRDVVGVWRSVGVVRVQKLMLAGPGTRRLVRSIMRALPSVMDLLVFTLIVFLLAAIQGREMFAGRLPAFADVGATLMTLVRVFVSDSWTDILWQGSAVACSSQESSSQLPAPPDERRPLCAGVVSQIAGR